MQNELSFIAHTYNMRVISRAYFLARNAIELNPSREPKVLTQFGA